MTYPRPDAGPHGTRRRTTWLWLSLAVAIAIIVALAAALISQTRDDSSVSPTPAAPPQSSASAAAPAPSSVAPNPGNTTQQPVTCEGYTASVDANSQPGWHATVNGLGLAYAVPPDWNVAACGVRMGWANPCPEGRCVVRDIGAVSTVANPTCPKENLAMAGVTSSKNPDIHAALDDELKTVPLIYTSQTGRIPDVKFGPVREFNIGPHPAVQVVATVTGIEETPCTGDSAFHSMVVTTVPNVEGSVVFLISLRKGAEASPKPDVINEIVKSLRSPA